MRNRYWNFFYEITYKKYYYESFYKFFKRINWIISAVLNITSLSSVAAWSIWGEHQLIWAILICFSQVIQALFPKLPYNDLLIAEQFMFPSLGKLYRSIERDWLAIDQKNLSEKKIMKKLLHHQQKYSDLVEFYMPSQFLPDIFFCEKEAAQNTQRFFRNNYNIEGM